MNKLIIKLFAILVMVVFSNVSIAKPLKPQVTVLHSSSKSNVGEALTYPKGIPKMTIAQVIFPVGAQLPTHTHPAPLIVHVMSGELTSERPSGDKVIYKAGDTFIAVVKESLTNNLSIQRSEVVRAVLIRTKKKIRRNDGSHICFDSNLVILINKDGNPRGSRVFGPISTEVRNKNFVKVASLAPEIF